LHPKEVKVEKRIVLSGLLIFVILDRIFTYLIIQKIGIDGEFWAIPRILMERIGTVEELAFSFLFLVFLTFFCYKFWWFRPARILACALFVLIGIVVCYNVFGLFYLNILQEPFHREALLISLI